MGPEVHANMQYGAGIDACNHARQLIDVADIDPAEVDSSNPESTFPPSRQSRILRVCSQHRQQGVECQSTHE